MKGRRTPKTTNTFMEIATTENLNERKKEFCIKFVKVCSRTYVKASETNLIDID